MKWSHKRFIAACIKLNIGSGHELARYCNQRRADAGVRERMCLKSAGRYMAGDTDPTRGAPGKPAAAFGLARDLGVSLDWLLDWTPPS